MQPNFRPFIASMKVIEMGNIPHGDFIIHVSTYAVTYYRQNTLVEEGIDNTIWKWIIILNTGESFYTTKESIWQLHREVNEPKHL